MKFRADYGAITKESVVERDSTLAPQSLSEKTLLRQLESIEAGSYHGEEISIEDALEDTGLQWPQIRCLIVISYLATCVCAELEAISLLGPELLCRWKLNGVQEALITNSFYCGAIIGSIGWGKISDIYGRKIALYSFCAVSTAFLLAAACSPGINTMIISLTFAGFGMGGYDVMYSYATEIVGRSKRSTACFFIFISVAMGAFLGSVLALFTIPYTEVTWRGYIAIISGMHLVAFILLSYCPETPRYLLVSDKPQKAIQVLGFFNPEQSYDIDLKPLEVKSLGSLSALVGSSDCFRNIIIMTIVCFFIRFVKLGTNLMFFESLQNPNAYNCILVESLDIEKSCQLFTVKDFNLQILSSTSSFFAAILSKIIVDSFGARRCLIFCGYFTVLQTSMFLFCKPKLLQTVLVITCRTVVNSANVLSTVFGTELFPTSFRGLALGIMMAGSEAGLAAAPLVAHFLSKINHPMSVACFVLASGLWALLTHGVKRDTTNSALSDCVSEEKSPKSSSLK